MSRIEKTYLSDYQPPCYTVVTTRLLFKLDPVSTEVTAEYHIRRLDPQATVLWLDGEDLQLDAVWLNGEEVASDQWHIACHRLGLDCDYDETIVKIKVRIAPSRNTQLQGLYMSGNNMCTQCEAEGFRRIVYSIDRPDVMSTYDVSCIYPINQFPNVIAAGQLVDQRALDNDQAYIRFVDNSPKSSYLFALVAGYFNTLTDYFTNSSGQRIDLKIHLPMQYTKDQAVFAMSALKKSMRWDEQVYGCVYDLPVYHIAAFADFNMGAMENKGLNIFNTSALLTLPGLTLDSGYLRVLSVVGHEFFHHWTGNRVGCANWFQLSLKEGLTTYREMRFAQDIYGDTARLDYIHALTEGQFREDRGPTAHAVIPQSYEKIDNFYTATIYTKGSEILRMLEDIMGRDVLDNAIQSYLQRYDGQATTMQSFLGVVFEHVNVDRHAFETWYRQIGTPKVILTTDYDPQQETLSVRVEQLAAQAKRQAVYEPVLIPIKCRLWSGMGHVLRPHADSVDRLQDDGTWVISTHSESQTFVLTGVKDKPIVAAFIGLSAPVVHHDMLSLEERCQLLVFESDPYVKLAQARHIWRSRLSTIHSVWSDVLTNAVSQLLDDWEQDPATTALVLQLPTLKSLQEEGGFDFDMLTQTHAQAEQYLAENWQTSWLQVFRQITQALRGAYQWNKKDAGLRKLRALALKMLVLADAEAYVPVACDLYDAADNLTDQAAAVEALLHAPGTVLEQCLARFQAHAAEHELLMDRWMYWSAKSCRDLDAVRCLLQHQHFLKFNPNRMYAWYSGMMDGNYGVFHQADGQGYVLFGQLVSEIDAVNPNTASRLISALLQGQYFDVQRQAAMRKVIALLLKQEGVSTMLREKLASVS